MKLKISIIMLIALIISTMVITGCIDSRLSFSKSEQLRQEKALIHVTYYFSPTCSYCIKESAMFDNLTEKYPNKFVLDKYDVSANESYWNDISMYVKKYNLPDEVVPLVIIGDKAFLGYYESNNIEIEKIISGKE